MSQCPNWKKINHVYHQESEVDFFNFIHSELRGLDMLMTVFKFAIKSIDGDHVGFKYADYLKNGFTKQELSILRKYANSVQESTPNRVFPTANSKREFLLKLGMEKTQMLIEEGIPAYYFDLLQNDPWVHFMQSNEKKGKKRGKSSHLDLESSAKKVHFSNEATTAVVINSPTPPPSVTSTISSFSPSIPTPTPISSPESECTKVYTVLGPPVNSASHSQFFTSSGSNSAHTITTSSGCNSGQICHAFAIGYPTTSSTMPGYMPPSVSSTNSSNQYVQAQMFENPPSFQSLMDDL